MPMWIQVFQSFPGQLSNQLKTRLEACVNWSPPVQTKPQNIKKATSIASMPMLKSLQELQIKMAKYESQTSELYTIQNQNTAQKTKFGQRT